MKICSKFTGEHPYQNEITLYWNHTSAWVFSCKFAAYFQNIFLKEQLRRAASERRSRTLATYLVIKNKTKIMVRMCAFKTSPSRQNEMFSFLRKGSEMLLTLEPIRSCSEKKMFLKISHTSPENICAWVSFR